MPAVSYDELEMAFAFVSSSPAMENAAYVCLDTGAIHCTSEFNPIDEEVPDDLETSDRDIPLPHKNDLDLGRPLVLRFVALRDWCAENDIRIIENNAGASA